MKNLNQKIDNSRKFKAKCAVQTKKTTTRNGHYQYTHHEIVRNFLNYHTGRSVITSGINIICFSTNHLKPKHANRAMRTKEAHVIPQKPNEEYN